MKDSFDRYLVNTNSTDDAEFAYTYSGRDVWQVTSDTPRVPQPRGFRIQLKPYQLASIHTMCEMETSKCFMSETNTYHSSAFVLSNSMGSGKTATMLGLITHNPTPTMGPHYPITTAYSYISCDLVTRSYTHVLRATLIFVGYGVLKQWGDEIDKFTTHMCYFVVDSVHTLRKFYSMLYTEEINKYDVVLIKNKDVTGEWKWQHNEAEVNTARGASKIYNMVGIMCRDMCFARLVLDDFDTIGMPSVAININALATWLVSSTKNTHSSKLLTNRHSTTVEELLHYNCILYNDIATNDVLYTLFNVQVAPSYYQFNELCNPQYFYYLFDNPLGAVMDLINGMQGDKIASIMEALNGDSVEEAAKLAGIVTNDVNQIFKALLQRNYEEIAVASAILLHFTEYFNNIVVANLPAYSANPDQTDTYTRLQVRVRRPLLWKYAGIQQLLDSEHQTQTDVVDRCGKCMQKFKDSVKKNECQVCCLELDDPDENYAIMPCCNEIIHADCAVRGCDFRKHSTPDGDVVMGYCPFDRTHKVLFAKVTYIKRGFDLSQIDETQFTIAPTSATAVEATEVVAEKRSKYAAILDVIQGRQAHEQRGIHLNIASVLTGQGKPTEPVYMQLDAYPSGVRQVLLRMFAPRVLIFSSFEENLQKIECMLKEHSINYCTLSGSMVQINTALSSFSAGRHNVMLIRSTTHCSSLNLQCATDLIFTHKIVNMHVQSQVVGRIQRPGRTSQARIHMMLFNNEFENLKEFVA